MTDLGRLLLCVGLPALVVVGGSLLVWLAFSWLWALITFVLAVRIMPYFMLWAWVSTDGEVKDA